LAGTKLYCLVTEAHRCEQLGQNRYAALPRLGIEPRPVDHKSNILYVAPPLNIHTNCQKLIFSDSARKFLIATNVQKVEMMTDMLLMTNTSDR